MDTKDWALVVGPLVGVLLGGLITSATKWIELRHNRSVAIKDARVEKLEGLCTDLNRISIEAGQWFQKIKLALASGEAERGSDHIVETSTLFASTARRIVTYVPRLAPKVNEFLIIGKDFGKVSDERAYTKLPLGNKQRDEIDKAHLKGYEDLARVCRHMISEMEDEIRNLLK